MVVRNKPRTVAVDTRPTIVEMILDETGSMQSYKNATINGFNLFLKEQRQESGECLMTLTKFDTSQDTTTPYQDIPLDMVPDLTDKTFAPNGCTNLYDAIGSRIEKLNRLSEWSETPNVLVIVMTDGQDNASKTFNIGTIAEMIKSKSDWTFVFLGADQKSIDIAHRMGFEPGNCKLYNTSEMYDTMVTLSNATTAYRSSGSTVTKSYFAQ